MLFTLKAKLLIQHHADKEKTNPNPKPIGMKLLLGQISFMPTLLIYVLDSISRGDIGLCWLI
jgi:hypothetical protein